MAIDDAGLQPADVDGLAMFSMEDGREVDVARNVGLGDITYFCQVGFGGGAGCGVVGQAAMAVATGQCQVAVAWRARKRAGEDQPPVGPGRRPARRAPAVEPAVRRCCARSTRSRSSPAGPCTSTATPAITSPTSRSRSASTPTRNPNATMGHKPLTREQYMDARWISEPLCLFDNCLETDGALAVVITSAERARDLRQPPAYVHAFAQSIPQQHQVMTNYFCDDPLLGPSWACARLLWEHSDFTARRCPRRAALRRVQPARPALARGLRLLRARRGRRLHRRRRARVAQRPAADQHRRAAGCPRRTCTASTSCSKACARCRGTSTSQVESAESCLVTSGEGVPTSAVLFRR